MNNLDIAIQASKKAWKAIMEIYNKREFSIEEKKDKSPVTEADLKADKIIQKELSQTWITILSEEKKDNLDRMKEKNLWIIDPIDGTKDFINKTWEFSIMIWLLQEWEITLWVVYVPAQDKLYYAQKWKWSYLLKKGKKEKLECDNTKDNLIILMSRNHTSKEEEKLVETMWIHELRCGSIWVKLWLIAENLWHLYLNLSDKTKEWDTCAPEIILKEAWWTITDTFWNDLEYNQQDTRRLNGILATNGIIHKDILEVIKNYED